MAAMETDLARSDTSDDDSFQGDQSFSTVTFSTVTNEAEGLNRSIPKLTVLATAYLYENKIFTRDKRTAAVILNYLEDAKQFVRNRFSSNNNIPSNDNMDISPCATDRNDSLKVVEEEHVKVENVSVSLENNALLCEDDRLTSTHTDTVPVFSSNDQSSETMEKELNEHVKVQNVSVALDKNAAQCEGDRLRSSHPDTVTATSSFAQSTGTQSIASSNLAFFESTIMSMETRSPWSSTSVDFLDLHMTSSGRAHGHGRRVISPATFLFHKESVPIDTNWQQNSKNTDGVMPLIRNRTDASLTPTTIGSSHDHLLSDVGVKLERDDDGNVSQSAAAPLKAEKNILEPILDSAGLDIKPNITEIKPQPPNEEDIIVLDDSSDEGPMVHVSNAQRSKTGNGVQNAPLDLSKVNDNGRPEHSECVRCVDCAKNIPEVDITCISSEEEKPIKQERHSDSGKSNISAVSTSHVKDKVGHRLKLGKRRRHLIDPEKSTISSKKLRLKSLPCTFFDKSDDDPDDAQSTSDASNGGKDKLAARKSERSPDNYTRCLMQAVSGGKHVTHTTSPQCSPPVSDERHGTSSIRSKPGTSTASFIPFFLESAVHSSQIYGSHVTTESAVTSSTPYMGTVDYLNKVACAAQVSEMEKVKALETRDLTIQHLQAELVSIRSKLDEKNNTITDQMAEISEKTDRIEHYKKRADKYKSKSQKKSTELEKINEQYQELKKIMSEQQFQSKQQSQNTTETVTTTEEYQIEIVQEQQTIVEHVKAAAAPEVCEKSTCTSPSVGSQISTASISRNKAEKEEENQKRKEGDLPSDLDDVQLDLDSDTLSLASAAPSTTVNSKASPESKNEVNGTNSSPVFGSKKIIQSPISTTQQSPTKSEHVRNEDPPPAVLSASPAKKSISLPDSQDEHLNTKQRLRACLSIASTLKEAVKVGLHSEDTSGDSSTEYKVLQTMCDHLQKMESTVGPMTTALGESDSDGLPNESGNESDGKSDVSEQPVSSPERKTPTPMSKETNDDDVDTDFSHTDGNDFGSDGQKSPIITAKDNNQQCPDSTSPDLDTDLRSRISNRNLSQQIPQRRLSGNGHSEKQDDAGRSSEHVPPALHETSGKKRQNVNKMDVFSPPKVQRLSTATNDRSITGVPDKVVRRTARSSMNPPMHLVSRAHGGTLDTFTPSATPALTTHLYSDVFNRGKTLGVSKAFGRKSKQQPMNSAAMNLSTSSDVTPFSDTTATEDVSALPKKRRSAKVTNKKPAAAKGKIGKQKTTRSGHRVEPQTIPDGQSPLDTLENATRSKLAAWSVDSTGKHFLSGSEKSGGKHDGKQSVNAEIHQKEAKSTQRKKTTSATDETEPLKTNPDKAPNVAAAGDNNDDQETSGSHTSVAVPAKLQPLLINHLQGQPLSAEQKQHELALYSAPAQSLQDILDLNYVPDDEAIMVQNLHKGNSQIVKNRKGQNSLYYATVKQIEEYNRADMLKRDFLNFVGNSLITRFSEIINVFLHDQEIDSNPQRYYESMHDASFRPDALTVVLLGIFLETNIDVVTATREWTLLEAWPQEIVLGYNGNNNFYATAKLRNPKGSKRAISMRKIKVKRSKQNKENNKHSNTQNVSKNHSNNQTPSKNQEVGSRKAEINEVGEGESEFQCYLCDDVKPRSRAEKRVHLACAHLTKEVFCMICDVDLLDHQNCMIHIRDNHQIRLYTCTHCSRNFGTKTALKKHEELHNASLLFKCELCGKGMRSKVHLKAHLHRHAQQKVNRCRYCKNTFITLGEMKRHVNYVHTAGPSFRCELCGKLYKSKENVKKHQNQHHKMGRLLPCPKCDKIFSVTQTYLNHVERQHGLPRKLPFKEDTVTV